MVGIEQETVLPYQNLHMYSSRWCYNRYNCVFACNFHILNNTFANLISICSLNIAGFSDIGHAHFCCTFRSLNRHICKTYFFKLLLHFSTICLKLCTQNLQMCLTKICQKNFGSLKNLLVITKQSFLLAKKHILFLSN